MVRNKKDTSLYLGSISPTQRIYCAEMKLNVLSWNAQGLLKRIRGTENYKSKFENVYFDTLNEKYDIICLSETWTSDNNVDNAELANYKMFYSNRHIFKKKTKRPHGGLLVYVKDSIAHGVYREKSGSDDILWLKFDKNVLNLDQDLFLCNVYISPQGSNMGHDTKECLEIEIANFSQEGRVLVCGDTNSRTGNEPDYIEQDSQQYVPLPPDYQPQTENVPRHNMDSVCNEYGKWLNDMCISNGLLILNGRVAGDTLGNYTYHGPNGSSTIDYFLTQETNLDCVQYLKVDDMTTLSDHCPITLSFRVPNRPCQIEIDVNTCTKKERPYELSPKNLKFITNPDSKEKFQTTLEQNKSYFDSFLKTNHKIDAKSCEEMILDFNKKLISMAKSSFKPVYSKKYKKKKRSKDPFFDKDCFQLKKELAYKLKMMTRYPNSRTFREDYYKSRKKYKKQVKQKESQFKDNILNQLEAMKNNDSKSYWSLLNQIKKGKSKSVNDTDYVSNQKWLDYFKDINQSKKGLGLGQKIGKLESENESLNNLDFDITLKEIHDGITSLKSGKSNGPDSILNEIIRFSRYYSAGCIQKIFNFCLKSGYFPKIWSGATITPLYKNKGSKKDPSNFRGISLTSSLGKLFTTILRNRLVSFLGENKKLHDNQSGFLPNRRTSDNLFILNQIMTEMRAKKQTIFLTFVDLKRAYDSVNHEALMLKLLKMGLGGKFYKVLRSMYMDNNNISRENSKSGQDTTVSKVQSCVSLPLGNTEFFQSSVGIKQGDGLSPILFNIFLNDIVDELHENTNFGYKLDESQQINTLLYADDLVIFSTSFKEMQLKLNQLETYCDKWQLEVSLKKSKVLFTGRKKQPKLKYKGGYLDYVTSFTYLGIKIHKSGITQQTKNELVMKAQKAWFKIKYILHSNRIRSPKLFSSLFDACVKPIITYGAEIWGHTDNPQANLFQLYDKKERLHLQSCKWLLNVSWKCSNIGVLGELGRYPLKLDIQQKMLKYWIHLQYSIDKNSILYKTYEKAKSLNSKWHCAINDILKYLNIDLKQTQSLSEKASQSTFFKDVKRKMKALFEKQWKEKLPKGQSNRNKNEEGKLRTYSIFKKDFACEEYLYSKIDLQTKTYFTKLRLSNHILQIEKGRFSKTDKASRFCTTCKDKSIEDEIHFILDCKLYTNKRNKLFDILSKNDNTFDNLDRINKFIYIMQCTSGTEDILSFVAQCYSFRENLDTVIK